VFQKDKALLEFLSNRLVELGDGVPAKLPTFTWDTARDPLADPRVGDPAKLPAEIFFKPGEKQPNRAGFARAGAYLNAIGAQDYGRPMFLVCAADLADSTNISGFGKEWGGFKGYGWYRREAGDKGTPGGVILPQEITEFTNSGLMCGVAQVNFSEQPLQDFRGYFGACSTYGSFSYLKYGPMRLFSQAAQDSQIKLGRVLWVAGHSGTGDGRGQPHALRHLLAGRDEPVPARPRDQHAPVGGQRGAGRDGRGAGHGRADPGAAPDAPARGDPGPRQAGHGQPPRRGEGGLPDPQLRPEPRAGGHDHRARHVVHGLDGEAAALVRGRRPQREGGRGHQLGAVPPPASQVEGAGAAHAGMVGQHGREQHGPLEHAELDPARGGGRVRAHAGPRRSLADRRLGGADRGREPPRPESIREAVLRFVRERNQRHERMRELLGAAAEAAGAART
jgi:hypothetical protein